MICKLVTSLLRKGALGAFLLCVGSAFAEPPTQPLPVTQHHQTAKSHKSTKTKVSKHSQAHKKKPSKKHATISSAKKKSVKKTAKPSKTKTTKTRTHSHRISHKRIHHSPIQPAQLPPLADQVNPALAPYQDLVSTDAKAEIGTPYVWGGTSPNGFDCSGFSQYVYREQGFLIPRTAAEQYENLPPVHHQLEPGDLVFFRLHGRGISHVGIYLGDGEFIHSPASGQDIRIDNLYSNYWRDHYAGARRVITWGSAGDNHFRLDDFDRQTNDQELETGTEETGTVADDDTGETTYPAEART